MSYYPLLSFIILCFHCYLLLSFIILCFHCYLLLSFIIFLNQENTNYILNDIISKLLLLSFAFLSCHIILYYPLLSFAFIVIYCYPLLSFMLQIKVPSNHLYILYYIYIYYMNII